MPAGIFPGPLSPDGQRLVFMLNPFDGAGPKELMILSVRDGSTKSLRKPTGTVTTSAWTPDARYVVYGQPKDDAGNRSNELWLVDTTGGQPRPVGILHQGIQGVAVHPDGKHLAYVTMTPPNQQEWLLENFLPPAKPAAPKLLAPPKK